MLVDESFISKRITELRYKKGISAREMSLSLGQSESYINKIENERALPSMAGFLYICEYFHITPSAFFDDKIHNPILIDELNHIVKKLSDEQIQMLIDFINAFI